MSCYYTDNLLIKKKIKQNDEPPPYKDLTSRNAVLTIYRDVNESNVEEEVSKLSLADQINQAVTWLSNYQVVLIEKNEQAKTNDKFSIKNILTSINKKNFEFKHQKNPTLQNYLIEAVEKQQEGIIDNVLLLIQPKQYEEANSINYFGISVAYQIQQSKKLQTTKENIKGNKVVYINLTGRESEQNLVNWDEIIQKDDEFLYFSFYKVQNQKVYLKQFQKQFQQMASSTCQQFVIPFICEDGKTINGNYLYSLFEMFLYNKIEKIPNLSYIALSLEISVEIEYEDYGLQRLIQSLMNLSHQKLIVHTHIIEKDVEGFEIKLKQGINMCYHCILEKCKNIDMHLKLSDRLKLIELLEQTHLLYQINDLTSWSESQQFTKAQYIKSSIEQKPYNINQEEVKEQYAILYKQNNQTFIITPKLEPPYKITDQTEIRIDYAEKLIIIYHDEINQDNRCFFLFYAKVTKEYLQPNQKTKFFEEDSKNRIELEFTKVELFDDLQSLQYPVMFQKDSIIYFFYGRHKQINFVCHRYHLKENYWDSLDRIEKDSKQNVFSNRISLKKLQQEDAQKIIQYRRGVSVSFENSKVENTMIVILFGGENDQIPQIVNSIEIIEIQLNELKYSSWFVDKYQIYKEITFKPFPNQIILQGIEETQAVNYIFLPGNDQIRRQKRNHPINQSFPDQVTVLRKTPSDCQMKKLKLEYIDQQYFDITYFNNRQYNVQFIARSKSTLVWRMIFFQTLTDEATYKTLTSLDIFIQGKTSNCFASTKQQQQNSLFQQTTEMPKDDQVLEYFQKYLQKYLQEKQKSEDAQLKKSQGIETEDTENYLLRRQLEQDSGKERTIEEESNSAFNISKLEIIEETPESKLVSKKFFLAFENYIFFDYKSKHLYLKQYIYQVLAPIKTQTQDIKESQDIEGMISGFKQGQSLQKTSV